MITFIEGGMRIPIGIVTKDYLRVHKLAPTQCAPNMFNILGSVDTLNEKMGLNLTLLPSTYYVPTFLRLCL